MEDDEAGVEECVPTGWGGGVGEGGEEGVDGCCWGGVGEGLRVGDGGVGAVLRGPRSSSTHTSISETSSLKDDPPASTHQSSG